MNLPQRRGGVRRQFFQCRNQRLILLFKNQSRGRVAMPAVEVPEQLHQLRPFQCGRHRALGRFEVFRRDPPNTTAIVAAVQIQVLLDALGNAPRMLDRFTVHIRHKETPIGRVGELHGPKPIIA